MKYIRTKDGRIVREDELDLVNNRKFLFLRNKYTNQFIANIEFECLSKDIDRIEDVIFAEYCKTNKLNIIDVKRERKIIIDSAWKQSDNIEELIDTFVICYPDVNPCNIGLTLPKKSRKYFIKETDVEAIYGAIWTDKGLIYVAKMNGKGEFELL